MTEAQPAPVAGTVQTFLIADMRGYTRFTMEHGDEAAARLAARFANLARRVVEGRGGEVIELRGDEVLAAFSSARQALWAAIVMQSRIAGEPGAALGLPLPDNSGEGADDSYPRPDHARTRCGTGRKHIQSHLALHGCAQNHGVRGVS